MSPYLFTLTFLLLMGSLTSSESIRFAQHALESRCYLQSRECVAAAEEARELSHLEEFKDEQNPNPKPRPSPSPNPKKKSGIQRIKRLDINTARPPDNARLNFYNFLHKPPHKDLPEEFSFYEVAAHLMRLLYQKAPFYFPNAEYLILDKIIEKKELTATFSTPDEFATLALDDSQLQHVFYCMLKGTKEAPSLLNYITFDKTDNPHSPSRNINLLFADPLILQAIFPQGQTAEKLVFYREKIWEEILDQEEHRLERTKGECKGRGMFGDDLGKLLQDVLTSENIDYKDYKKQVFDLTLGKPGSVLFTQDPLTGTLHREKYLPPKKT